ncbi:MAG: cytochrome c oxidase assembly factor Coa1 family protein [Bryobacterales bacterium]
MGRWLDRNAKWVIPVGIGVFLGLAGLGIFGFLRWFDSFIRGQPSYRMALQELRSHREANEALGSPITAEGQIQGSWQRTGPRTVATYSVPVQGSRRTGRLLVQATAFGDDWTLERVTLQLRGPPGSIVIIAPSASGK